MERPVVVERCAGARGELVLRRHGAHFELIANGTFLMDTRAGASERRLVRAAIGAAARTRSILIGGLGVGFSLAEAVTVRECARIVVVEIEQAVLRWQREHLGPFTAHAWRDPRVALVHADLLDWLPTCRECFDAVCLDVDNGPDWTVAPGNARLYTDAGLAAVERVLAPGGALAVWSAHAAPAFEARLGARFDGVRVIDTTAARGEPDRVYVARRRPHAASAGPAPDRRGGAVV